MHDDFVYATPLALVVQKTVNNAINWIEHYI